jgi:hypothetical protein
MRRISTKTSNEIKELDQKELINNIPIVKVFNIFIVSF